MGDPTRWKSDDSFIQETGIDLNVEEASVQGYDLAGMKAAVEAAQAGGASGLGLMHVGGATAVAVAFFASAFWLQADSVDQGTAVAPPSGDVVAAAPVQQPAVAETVGTVAEVVAITPRTPAASTTAPLVERTVEGVADAPEEASEDPAEQPILAPELWGAAEAGTAEAPAPAAEAEGELAAQLAMYQDGRALLDDDQLTAANAVFARYLETWPQGSLRDEVLVSMLDVLVRQQDWSQVERVSASLLTLSTLSARHGEFWRVRAEALVKLGRCDEALSVASNLSRTEQQTVRRSCRVGAQ